MQQKEVLACRGAGCNVTGVAKRWDTAKTPDSFWIAINTQEPQGGLWLQNSCKEGVDGVNATHTGVQRAANTSRGADTAQLAQPGASYGTSTAIPVPLVTVLLLLAYLKYTGVPLFSPPSLIFFFLPRLQCWFVFISRANSRNSEEGSADWSCWPWLSVWQGTDHTAASEPLLNTSSRLSLWTFLLHPLLLERWAPPFPPTAPCTFPSRRSLRFGSWLPVKAKATHKGINQQ